MLPKPPDGYFQESEAQQALQVFVFGDKYDPVNLPKRADPRQADDFVKKVLDDKDLRVRPLTRCGMLMRFFDLRVRAEQVVKWIDRREIEQDQYPRLMTAVGIVGDLGEAPMQDRAAQLYQLMLTHRKAEKHFPNLIDCLFHLSAADPKWVSDALNQRARDLQARADADQDAAVAHNDVKDWLADRLPTVSDARKKREDVMKIAAADRRRSEFARYYLQLEVNGYIDMAAWGMMMLQRECNESSPPEIAGELSHVLDIMISRGTAMRSPTPKDQQDLKIYVTRCVHAIEFYQGKLSDKQAEFAAKHNNEKQTDVLQWEKQ